MADLVPGTPEYQKEYDEEMQRLEAGAESPEKVEDAPITKTEEVVEETTEAEKPSVDDEIKQLREQLAKQEKIAKDNHAAFTKRSQEMAKLQRKLEKEERDRLRPEILDSVPGLEDAVKYVTQPSQKTAEPWLDTVSRALPDINTLLGDQAFFQKVEAIRANAGEEWDDPVIAIRELSNARAEYRQEQAIVQVREQVKKDFETRNKNLGAMSVATGTSRPAKQKTDQDKAQDVWSMPAADFKAMQAKTKGY